MVSSGCFQSAIDQIDVRLRRFDATDRLFLKAVNHINQTLKPHGIDGAIGVARIVLNNFNYARTLSPKRLGIGMFAACLGQINRVPKDILNICWHFVQIFLGGANPFNRLQAVAVSALGDRVELVASAKVENGFSDLDVPAGFTLSRKKGPASGCCKPCSHKHVFEGLALGGAIDGKVGAVNGDDVGHPAEIGQPHQRGIGQVHRPVGIFAHHGGQPGQVFYVQASNLHGSLGMAGMQPQQKISLRMGAEIEKVHHFTDDFPSGEKLQARCVSTKKVKCFLMMVVARIKQRCQGPAVSQYLTVSDGRHRLFAQCRGGALGGEPLAHHLLDASRLPLRVTVAAK